MLVQECTNTIEINNYSLMKLKAHSTRQKLCLTGDQNLRLDRPWVKGENQILLF